MAPSANLFFSNIVTLGAAAFILSQGFSPQGFEGRLMRLWFAVWLVVSLTVIVFLWIRHQNLIKTIGDYKPLISRKP
jgi:predicted aspartyl protease